MRRLMLSNLALLVGAHLIAVQIRLRLPWGNALGTDYQGDPPGFYVIAVLSTLVAFGAAWLVARTPKGALILAPQRRFRLLMLSAALNTLAVLLLLPDLSQLQMIYFAVGVTLLAVFMIIVPGRVVRAHRSTDFWDGLAGVWRSRFLLGLWLGYNVQKRYSQTVLGILWIVLLPLATAGVLSLAFSQILQVELDVPFISFFLSGLVPWGLFSQGVLNGMTALVGKMHLLNQVPFPREVPVLLALGEALVDLLFVFLAMLVVNALNGILPNANYIYLLPLVVIFACFTLGLMFFLSCLTVFVRDMPQLVSVALQLLFYLTPLIYPVSKIPDHLRALILINPLASVVGAFRDVILYDRAPDILTLYYPAVVSLALLYVGYAYFVVNKERVTDFV